MTSIDNLQVAKPETYDDEKFCQLLRDKPSIFIKLPKYTIFVFSVQDWKYLATEANVQSLFKCKWAWASIPI